MRRGGASPTRIGWATRWPTVWRKQQPAGSCRRASTSPAGAPAWPTWRRFSGCWRPCSWRCSKPTTKRRPASSRVCAALGGGGDELQGCRWPSRNRGVQVLRLHRAQCQPTEFSSRQASTSSSGARAHCVVVGASGKPLMAAGTPWLSHRALWGGQGGDGRGRPMLSPALAACFAANAALVKCRRRAAGVRFKASCVRRGVRSRPPICQRTNGQSPTSSIGASTSHGC